MTQNREIAAAERWFETQAKRLQTSREAIVKLYRRVGRDVIEACRNRAAFDVVMAHRGHANPRRDQQSKNELREAGKLAVRANFCRR